MKTTYNKEDFFDLIESGNIPPTALITLEKDGLIPWYGKCISNRLHLVFNEGSNRNKPAAELISLIGSSYGHTYAFWAVRMSYASSPEHIVFKLTTSRISKTKPL